MEKQKMTKQLSYLLLLVNMLFTASAICQELVKPDTSAYELQRQKVNQLLDQRSARFGQFDESLNKRTGIFGLKTKKDMQASIDILKEIVLTDNHIFKETKRLLDFKDSEKAEIEKQASEFDSRINGYIMTISKLQKEQAALRMQIDLLEHDNQTTSGFLGFGIILLSIAVGSLIGYWFLHIQLKKRKAKREALHAKLPKPSNELI